jgi:hypothetical protein
MKALQNERDMAALAARASKTLTGVLSALIVAIESADRVAEAPRDVEALCALGVAIDMLKETFANAKGALEVPQGKTRE